MRTQLDDFSSNFAAITRGDSQHCRETPHGNSPPLSDSGAAAIADPCASVAGIFAQWRLP
jgi:hypothetical protein